MRILILEDEPIIAIDLEDIVTSSRSDAECVLAGNTRAGLARVAEGVDFAMLDIRLGSQGEDCWAVAAKLRENRIPFCFITGNRRDIGQTYAKVPVVEKPFQPTEVTNVVPLAA